MSDNRKMWFIPQLEEGSFTRLPKGKIPDKAIFGYRAAPSSSKGEDQYAATREEANERAVELFLKTLDNRMRNLQRHIDRLTRLKESIRVNLELYRQNKESKDE